MVMVVAYFKAFQLLDGLRNPHKIKSHVMTWQINVEIYYCPPNYLKTVSLTILVQTVHKDVHHIQSGSQVRIRNRHLPIASQIFHPV